MSELPNGWIRAPLKLLLSNQGIFSDGDWVESKDQDPHGSIRLLQLADIGDGYFIDKSSRFVNEEKFTSLNCTELKTGDVLIARMPDPLGRACLLPELSQPCITVVDIAVFRAGENGVCNKWLMNVINSPAMRGFMEINSSGTTRKRISRGKLSDMELPIPPLSEQKRIADKLDTVLARVDACRERLNRVPLILKRFRQSVLAAAISGKLTEDWKQRKNEWTYSKTEELCEWITKGTTPPKSGMHEGSGDIPYIKVYNLCFDGKLDFTVNPTFVDKDTHEIMLKRSKVFPGDILMNIVGPPLGKVSIVPDSFPEWNINQAIAVFRVKPEIYNRFLAYFLICEATIAGLIKKSKATAGQFNLTLEICRQIDVPVPSMDEQHEIVRRVETLFAFADRLEARLATARTATDRLTPALLAKAFRGELVPQDPNDEPAAELLKRLAAARTATSDKPRRARAAKVGKRPSDHPSQVCDS